MLLELDAVSKSFPLAGGGQMQAVQAVSLQLASGEALGLVGESGCGKTTLGRLCVRLMDASAGSVRFAGQDLAQLDAKALRAYRAQAQFVFQDPHSALNPRMSIFRSVAEPLILHTATRGPALRDQVAELLATVGLPAQFLPRYPHELSGGQKQRVCLARAIALQPQLLVLDEPTSALDVSVQAQILDMLRELQQRLGLAYLFISHNLAVIRALCPRVAVMYLGRIVEEGPTEAVFTDPKHPYTQALIDAIPVPEAVQPLRRFRLQGDIPVQTKGFAGCPFAPRCPQRTMGRCDALPELVHDGHRGVRCHLYADSPPDA